jgi:serine/threonine protein kinase
MSQDKFSTQALIGTVLEGIYRIDSLLGEGGMGAVYAATHLRLKKQVAVKVMAHVLTTHSESLARFHREAEITSALGHPHIVQVIDFSTTPTGEPFLVMEFLEGEDLEHRLLRVGRLPIATVVPIVKQVASALAATHAKGVIHRDLKPANIYLLEVAGETDFVKVLDFGISKVRTSNLTRTSSVLGTPRYMSPEQAEGRGDDIDERTDQWALACIAWECLTGECAFDGENLPSIIYKIMGQAPPAIASKVAGINPLVEKVLLHALAKKKDERYASLNDFATALEAVAGGSALISPAGIPPESVPVASKSSGLGLSTTFSQTAGEPENISKTWSSQSKWIWAAVASTTAILLVTAVLLFRPSPDAKPVVASPPLQPDVQMVKAPEMPPTPPVPAASPTPKAPGDSESTAANVSPPADVVKPATNPTRAKKTGKAEGPDKVNPW